MRILIIAATEKETLYLSKFTKSNVDILITGIGAPISIFKLTEVTNKKKYDLIINIGISGSFSKTIKIGEVVNIQSEIFADLGFEEPNSFIPLSENAFKSKQLIKFDNPNNSFFPMGMKKTKGITVNSCSGNLNTIKMRKKFFNADIESMEGAGIFLVCLEKNIPFIEIRAISNYIEPRNTNNWNIPLAIKNLNSEINSYVNLLLTKPNE